MALIIPHALRPGLAPHDFFVRAKVKDLRKSKIVSPQTEEEREAFVEGPAKEAFDAAIKEGLPEAYAKSEAQKARLAAQSILSELLVQDRRSVVALEFWIRAEDADLPEAKPEHTAYLAFDYDLESDLDAIAQAYAAAKADPRFAGARDA